MKDKKRVTLIILFILIFIVALSLLCILIFGSIASKKDKEYRSKIEEAACKYVKEYNITADIADAFPGKNIVNLPMLLETDYLSKDLKNEVTKIKITEDTGYVELTWIDKTVKCTYKEGK
jgi:flagellar basal body-associated protein FliL